MSTQDYVPRSVETVLVLLLGVSVLAALWVLLDRWLSPRAAALRNDDPSDDAALRAVGAAPHAFGWLILPASVARGPGPPRPPVAYVLWPVSIGVGALLPSSTRRTLGGVDMGADRTRGAGWRSSRRRGSSSRCVPVLFWTGSNYAFTDGADLAADIYGIPPRSCPGWCSAATSPCISRGQAYGRGGGGGTSTRYRYLDCGSWSTPRAVTSSSATAGRLDLGVVFVVPEKA